jgi:transcriptional regulator with XRE-family HTH domain
MPEAAATNFTINLRRLLLFENQSGKEAAAALGINEATMSRWLTGKRYPNAPALIAIDRLYGVTPRDLDDDPITFAQKLADPARIKYAEAMREAAENAILITDAQADALRKELEAAVEAAKRNASKVTDIRTRAKKK